MIHSILFHKFAALIYLLFNLNALHFMKNSFNVTLSSKRFFISVLKTYESELNHICDSPFINVDSALYGFLFAARNCITLALNHTDELK